MDVALSAGGLGRIGVRCSCHRCARVVRVRGYDVVDFFRRWRSERSVLLVRVARQFGCGDHVGQSGAGSGDDNQFSGGSRTESKLRNGSGVHSAGIHGQRNNGMALSDRLHVIAEQRGFTWEDRRHESSVAQLETRRAEVRRHLGNLYQSLGRHVSQLRRRLVCIRRNVDQRLQSDTFHRDGPFIYRNQLHGVQRAGTVRDADLPRSAIVDYDDDDNEHNDYGDIYDDDDYPSFAGSSDSGVSPVNGSRLGAVVFHGRGAAGRLDGEV